MKVKPESRIWPDDWYIKCPPKKFKLNKRCTATKDEIFPKIVTVKSLAEKEYLSMSAEYLSSYKLNLDIYVFFHHFTLRSLKRASRENTQKASRPYYEEC